jgi:GNAT superfamily N-acetyltransferase
VIVRTLRARGCAERALVARLVPRCSPEALRARLFVPSGRRLGPWVVDLLTGGEDSVGYLAMDGHRPVGLANVAPGRDGSVEVALLVADRWRRRGIGRRLVVEALADPRWAGREVRATVAPENRAILLLLRSAGLSTRLVGSGPGELELQLRPPAPVAAGPGHAVAPLAG